MGWYATTFCPKCQKYSDYIEQFPSDGNMKGIINILCDSCLKEVTRRYTKRYNAFMTRRHKKLGLDKLTIHDEDDRQIKYGYDHLLMGNE